MNMIHKKKEMLLLALLFASSSLPSNTALTITRNSFPHSFIFGAGSSAYQYEGAAKADGRKPSIWDVFVTENPQKIADHSTGNKADAFYYLYKEDVVGMKEIGLDSFRFSISWSRVLPEGKVSKGVNEDGVRFYNDLINELLANGIQPLVTLFHWDLPQALEEEYGGFLSPDIVQDYLDYVEVCFQEFGDRVKYWITLNEPHNFSAYGYCLGTDAPGRCSDYIGNCTAGNSATEPYLVTHHLILCHAAAVKLYRDDYKASQNGTIGISVQTIWPVPKYNTSNSLNAAHRVLDFSFGWVVHPIIYGDYPKTIRVLVGNRLPRFTDEQVRLIKGSTDFLGLNFYTALYADDVHSYPTTLNLSYTTDSRVNVTTEKDGIPIGEPTGVTWYYLYPQGLLELLRYIKRNYGDFPIYITENGVGVENNNSLPNVLVDELRIKYHYLHLSYLLRAIKEGVDVRAYYIWSLLDDFEWSGGYTTRFGLTYVDYANNLKRYFKKSAFWFHDFLSNVSISSLFAAI